MKVPVTIDTREQRPYLFERYEVRLSKHALSAGDYALTGLDDCCGIERKSKADMFHTYSKGQRRFTRMLTLMRERHPYNAVVIECTMAEFMKGPDYWRGRRNRKAHARIVRSTILGWQSSYRTPFLFIGNRDQTEYYVYDMLRIWYGRLKGGR